jgi:hypothetical protein
MGTSVERLLRETRRTFFALHTLRMRVGFMKCKPHRKLGVENKHTLRVVLTEDFRHGDDAFRGSVSVARMVE